MEVILQRWEDFASTRTPAAERMSRLSLRNHGPEILIVADLAIAQTPEEQSAKSMGFAQIVVGASHAVHYGESREAIHVAVRGDVAEVCLTVANSGETIDGDSLALRTRPPQTMPRCA